MPQTTRTRTSARETPTESRGQVSAVPGGNRSAGPLGWAVTWSPGVSACALGLWKQQRAKGRQRWTPKAWESRDCGITPTLGSSRT